MSGNAMQGPLVMIATPHIGGVPNEWVSALIGLEKPEYWCNVSVIRHEIASARNALAMMMMNPTCPRLEPSWRENPQAVAFGKAATHLLFWDDDTIPPSDGLMRLLAHDLPIVCGFYVTRHTPSSPLSAIRRPDGNYETLKHYHPGLNEVDAMGTGFMLIKREVFARMEQPWFHYICGPDLMNGGEDYYFCEKARALGYPIYLDFDVQCGHLGTKMYRREDALSTTPPKPPALPSRQARRAAARRR